ncbi:AMP-dependent synthetase/ligase [Nocardioides pacificus]
MSAITRGTNPTTLPAVAVSVAQMFQDRVARTPDAEAYRFPTRNGWASYTWLETQQRVRVLAAGLLALGIEPEDRVAIASGTRIEWVLADLAITCSGAATTAVYPTTSAKDVSFILADSGSRIAFVEDQTQIDKLWAWRDQLPALEKVIRFDGKGDGEWVIGLEDLRALGKRRLDEDPTCVDEAIAAITSGQLATLMYTSGTTAQPKGVELPHSCWTYVGAGAESLGILTSDDLQFLWLPLSHSFGKMLEAVQLQIGFATAIDGRMDKIVDNLAEVRPTFMAGPPRIFEKVHGKVKQSVQADGGVKKALFDWAFRVGRTVSRCRLEGLRPSPLVRLEHTVADRLVLAKIRDRLGGRIRFLLSGSAALSADVASWFHAAGLPVLEGYGLTETSAAGCIGQLEDLVFGHVGPPITGTEVRIAADGEIFLRGPSVMRGYHHLPEETAAVLSPDGWFATGDVGELDEQGRLRITDRKKDLIKTSGGKYIAPQAIEVLFRAGCPLASQMIVHAEGRHYATALVSLDPDALTEWAVSQGITTRDYRALTDSPAVRDYVQECVDNLNRQLNRWETIKDFRILDHDLSVTNGELTPSMKVRRKVVEADHRGLLETMYAK